MNCCYKNYCKFPLISISCIHTFFPQCNRSNSSSPVDKLGQPRLTKLTRMRTDKKSEFLKTLKQDRVEEEQDENCVGQEKVPAVLIPLEL